MNALKFIFCCIWLVICLPVVLPIMIAITSYRIADNWCENIGDWL